MEGLFDPQPLIEFDQYGSPDPYMDAANKAAKRGYPGTALHYLREGLWFSWVAKPFPLARQIVEVYRMMNRPILAVELAHTMGRWREMRG